ncbi:uncharacterized protein AB9X84_002985 isoform 1-T1 [Acanthopagrus schlegelii]
MHTRARTDVCTQADEDRCRVHTVTAPQMNCFQHIRGVKHEVSDVQSKDHRWAALLPGEAEACCNKLKPALQLLWTRYSRKEEKHLMRPGDEEQQSQRETELRV